MAYDGAPGAAWKGYWPAIVTPFNRNGRIDWQGFRILIDWLCERGVHGMVVGGTTGEWSALTLKERTSLFIAARAAVSKPIPLIAGCSALRVAESAQLMQVAAELKLDGALLTVPPYVCPSEREALMFYRQMGGLARIPIIAYNWPQGTGIDFSVESCEALAQLDGIAAIKHSTPDAELFARTVRRLHSKIPIFGVMPGRAGLRILEKHGGVGCIGATGVLAEKQAGFFEAYWRGDLAQAERLGSFDERLMASLFDGFKGRYGHAIATLKYLLKLRGLPGGHVRSPLMDLCQSAKKSIRGIVQASGLFDEV